MSGLLGDVTLRIHAEERADSYLLEVRRLAKLVTRQRRELSERPKVRLELRGTIR